MDARLNIITLGVKSVGKSKAFYTKLGWHPSKASQGDIVFFQLGGVVLALYPRVELAKDAMVEGKGTGFRGFTLAQNVRSKKEVDQTLARAKKAGGKLVKSPQEAVWGGYSGYFSDIDGHLWEIAWNPFFKLDKKGRLELP